MGWRIQRRTIQNNPGHNGREAGDGGKNLRPEPTGKTLNFSAGVVPISGLDQAVR